MQVYVIDDDEIVRDSLDVRNRRVVYTFFTKIA